MAFYGQTFTVDENGVSLTPSSASKSPGAKDPSGSVLIPATPEVRVGSSWADGYTLPASQRFTWTLSDGTPELWTDTGQSVNIDVLWGGLVSA